MLKNIKKHHILLLLVVLFAAILLPSTSPIRFHDIKCMTNDYFNFAKSMMQGDILYVDLFDHKGIVLFLLYYIPVLVSDTSLIGVFLLEGIVSAGIALSCYLYLEKQNKCSKTMSCVITLITVIISKLLFSQTMLNTEPLCIIIFFLLLRYIEGKNYETYKKKDYLLFGLAFGTIFWMKYPIVLLLFPFWLYLLVKSIQSKKIGLFIKRCLLSFLIVFLMSAAVVLYFWKVNALDIMFQTYFTMGHTMSLFFIGSTLEISLALIAVLSIIGIIIDKNKRKAFFAFSLICIMLMANMGGFRAYTASPLVILLPLYIPELWKQRYIRPIVAGVIAFIVLLYIPKGIVNSSQNIERISQKYQITNQNILYLCEDIGFGNYSSDNYKEKGQWLPGRVTYEENKEFFERTFKWIKNKEFSYVCVDANYFDITIDDKTYKESKYAKIIKELQENYEIAEAFVYNEAMPVNYYLLKVK